jgi:MFS family permease
MPATPWELPQYRMFLVSLAAATLASQVQAAAVAYQIYALTRDPLSLGLIGLAEALPFIGLALPAGHLADVRDRRGISVRGLAVLAIAGLALLVLAVPVVGRHLGAGPVKAGAYGIIAATGVVRSFLQPARAALGADIVPRALYPAAVSARAGTWQAAAVMGPALGGTIYGMFGAPVAYAVTVLGYGVALLAMRRIRPPARQPEEGQERERPAMLRSLREGLAFVWSEKVILPAIALDLFAVLFGGAVALLPIFAEEILRVGPLGFGLLRAAPAAGAVATSVVLALGARRAAFKSTGRVLLWSVAVYGVCMIGFALSRWFVLSLALLAAGGAADMVSVVIRGTLIQVRVPGTMLGRMSAINQIFIGSSNEIGAFESGLAARLLGTVPSVVAGGAATLLIVAVTAWRAPALRRLGALR